MAVDRERFEAALKENDAKQREKDTRAAEEKIQKILLGLEEAWGWRVDYVEVDTRNFANLRTEIFLVEGWRK